ncbi:MAG: AmmeMemoRadiSam system protein B, partial [Candidatus Omnitrophota bacterium]
MKKRIFFAVISFLIIFPTLNISFAQQIREPVVSGSFYPASARILAQKLKQFLDWAEVKKRNEDALVLISPHAGYDYSASTAAYGYNLIKASPIHTVIIIGPSHYEYFEGISVYPEGSWQTPLGNVPVNSEIAQALIAYSKEIFFYPPAFAKEHSIEVQLPFLQVVLDDFKIVPIVIGKESYENCLLLSQALLETTKDKEGILLIASTDMSHYHPAEEAVQIDSTTIQTIQKFDPALLYNKAANKECELCGASAVVTSLLYAQGRGADKVEVLKYINSGEITGEPQRVVGYLSAVIFASSPDTKAENNAEKESMKATTTLLSETQKKRLLEIARQSIREYLNTGKEITLQETDPLLIKNMGAFVTIHRKGNLRGCIGHIIGVQPLYLTVRDMAVEAAVGDPRFVPLTSGELPDVDIEISVLSEPQRIQDIEEIKMGIHGVIVQKGTSSGVFLPQVAAETGWTKEEFLSNLCAQKAGLSPVAWKDKDTE